MPAANDFIREQGEHGAYWLPEAYTLRLTAFEAGALMAILTQYAASDHPDFPVNVEGREGPMQMADRLVEKLHFAVFPEYRDRK